MGRVKEMSVFTSESLETFCTIMSMLMPASEMTSKMEAAAPTWSGTPMTVILASLRSWATPVMMASSMLSAFLTSSWGFTQVPGLSLKDERTWTFTFSRRAYSTQRKWRILAPEAASSIISS